MRWLTPQELAKLSGKSERTIRHYASQDQFTQKRDGKKWVIEPMSAMKKGFIIPQEELDKLRVPQLASEEVTKSNTILPPDHKLEKKQYKKLRELGVYKDLRELLSKEVSLSPAVKEHLKVALMNLALGFFEYNKSLKVDFFRKARQFLVCACVECDISHQEENPTWRFFIEESLIAGTIGLIRQHEGAKRKGKNTQQNQYQNNH